VVLSGGGVGSALSLQVPKRPRYGYGYGPGARLARLADTRKAGEWTITGEIEGERGYKGRLDRRRGTRLRADAASRAEQQKRRTRGLALGRPAGAETRQRQHESHAQSHSRRGRQP
jgi:hypothetical protein